MFRWIPTSFLFLVFLSPNSKASDIEGTYYRANGTYFISIDANDYLETNIMVVDKTTGERLPIHFPHRLKYDLNKEIYRTHGTFRPSYYTAGGYKTCNFSVTLMADIVGDSMDATFSMAREFGLNSFGNCNEWGHQQEYYNLQRQY